MIVRFEPWGAWVRVEAPPALVALDRDGVRALGLDGGAAWSASARTHRAPLEVHLAVTSRCGAGCEGCYLDAKPDGREPDAPDLVAQLDALADAGVFTVAFGGGEPTLRDDLGELARHARSRGLLPVVTTSGLGLGDRKLAQLADFAQVNVSYDGAGDAYASVRGFDGAAVAERAIRELCARGMRVGVNVVLTRGTFDALPATVRRAREMGAVEVQLLRFKPAGRARSLEYLGKRLSPAQSVRLASVFRALVAEHSPAVTFRIDCALVPMLSTDPDLTSRPDELARWGIFGCEAGGHLAAARVDGRVAPCSFAEPSELRTTALKDGFPTDTRLAAFRDFTEGPPEPCASCTLRPICKGGCKVVSEYTDGVIGPDPECPRVLAHRAEA